MLGPELTEISKRFKEAQIGLKEMLSVIDLTSGDQSKGSGSYFPEDFLGGLDELIDRTVHGTRIERVRPGKGNSPFHTFEIHTEDGGVLGYLNMICFRKPVPCHYLVYVEILSSFRGRGLGEKILKAFRAFTEDHGSVGLLDNIIPREDPTYGIYTKLGWQPIEDLTGGKRVNGQGQGHYMVFVPAFIKTSDLRGKLIKLLFKIRKKRPIIDMHDNEVMVKRTISEFRHVYAILERLFETELSTGTSAPLLHYMFTKLLTKVLGFQRRIASLLGYTGGESLEQFSISERVKSLPFQPYSLWSSREGQVEVCGNEEILRTFPEELKTEPTKYIESLPLYQRPYLSSWINKEKEGRSLNLRIGDILELGFDPTRLREFQCRGMEYIFERMSPHFLPFIKRRREVFLKIGDPVEKMGFHPTSVHINPPLAILRDRGNVYVLRAKVGGIHLEEGLDQLRSAAHLKDMNRMMGVDRLAVTTINKIKERLQKLLEPDAGEEIEDLAFFISWDLQNNIPKLMVDVTGISIHAVWIA